MADLYYIEQGYYTPDGYFVYVADADLTVSSDGTLTALGGIQRDATATLSAEATVSCDAQRLGAPIEATANLNASVSVSTDAAKTVDVSSTQNTEFTVSGSAGRILEGQGTFTGAFTPTLSVEVIKNHTAVLDAVFNTVTVGVANRATSITVDTIAALDAQAAKTVDVQSTQASSATATINGNSQRSATATLTSTVTLSAEAYNVQFGQVSLTATSSVYASRYFGSYRPMSGTFVGSADYVTSPKKYGTHSLRLVNSTSRYNLEATGEHIVRSNEDFVAEAWIYIDGDQTSDRTLFGVGAGPSNFGSIDAQDSWAIGHDFNNRYLLFKYVNPNGVVSTITTTQTLPSGQWIHIAVRRASNVIQLYYNGSPVGSATSYSDAFRLPATASNRRFYILNPYSADNRTIYYDEVSYRIGSSFISGLSSAITNDATTHILLLHFDNNADDDLTVQHQGQSALSSTTNLVASAQETSSASANLTSTATITATGSLLNVGEAQLNSAATLSATVGLAQSAQTSITAESSITIDAVKTADVSSTQNADSNQSTAINRTRDFEINVTGAFTPTLSVDVIRNHTAILDAVSTVSAQINGNFTGSAELTSTVTVNADTAVIRTVNIDAAASVTQSTDIDRIRTTATNWLSEFQVTAQAGQEQEAASSITAESTVTVNTDRIRALDSTQFSTSTLQLTAANVYRNLGDQTLSAQATVDSTVTNRIGFVVDLTSTATIAIDAVKITDAVSVQNSKFSQSAQAVKTVNPATAFSSIATQLTGIGYNATGTVLLESTSTLSVLIGKIIEYPSNEISGILADSDQSRYAQITTSGGALDKQVGLVMSIWARRDDLNDSQDAFWSSNYVSGSLARFEYFNQTTARFAASTAGTIEYWLWPNTVPYDNLWHHYIIRYVGTQPITNRDILELWVDGIYKGTTTNSQGLILSWSIPGNNINIGTGRIAGSESENLNFDGDLAQIWIGVDPTFTLSKLWNGGAIDLGTDGRNNNTLPTPRYYNSLDYPYTNVTFYEDDNVNTAIGADQPLPLPDMTARAGLTVSTLGVFLVVANLSATTTLSCSAVKTASAASTQTAACTVVTNAVKNTGIISNQSSEFTVDADVNLGPAGGAALFDHSATLSATVGYLRDQTSTQSVTATMAIEATEIPPLSGDAALTVFASQSTVAGYLISAQSSKSAVTTMTVEGTIIDPVRASGTLTVDTALTCSINRVRPGISLVMSAGTLTADISVIPPLRTSAILESQFTLTAEVSGTYGGISLVVSAGTMTIVAAKITDVNADFESNGTVSVQAFKATGIIAFLTAQGFTLTTGDVINIDPYLTLRITPENRLIKIEAETRTINITAESRTLLIEGYSQ